MQCSKFNFAGSPVGALSLWKFTFGSFWTAIGIRSWKLSDGVRLSIVGANLRWMFGCGVDPIT
jgi:hypothetical protein